MFVEFKEPGASYLTAVNVMLVRRVCVGGLGSGQKPVTKICFDKDDYINVTEKLDDVIASLRDAVLKMKL